MTDKERLPYPCDTCDSLEARSAAQAIRDSEIQLSAGEPLLDDQGYTPVKFVDLFRHGQGWVHLFRRAGWDRDGYICDLGDEIPTDIYNQGRLMNGSGREHYYGQLRARAT